MSDEIKDKNEINEENTPQEHSDYKPVNRFDASAVHHLSGMYQNWFLDYASYVILERAVPHIEDGLKPVQRRILHSMKRMDDGRYNKVANIVGHTMQFHPHGDASIGDALVQMGQKDLLIDTQGNWGNILTGDRAAAPRYIEARLSKFALDVVFNPKTTDWQLSYDGRNKEPITLPAKFPLLLAQGAEGIAVGLSSKVLPHNFNDLCDAAIHYLKGEPFSIYPDFPTGGAIDVSKYNDGQRGGVLKVRAKIDKLTYLVYAFCTGHYFADGNKRISLVIGAHFLVKNRNGWAGFHFLPHMEAYIWHVAAGNIDKELLGRIIHFVINGQELDETTKIDVIRAMKKSPLYSEEDESE